VLVENSTKICWTTTFEKCRRRQLLGVAGVVLGDSQYKFIRSLHVSIK